MNPRKWVGPEESEARRVFELQPVKGAAFEPRWGLALRFVPHIAAGKIRWHRTAKSAIPDVLNDLRQFPGNPYVSFLFGEERFRSELAAVMDRAVVGALSLWDRAADFGALVEFLVTFRDSRLPGLGFRNFVQPPLALAFLLARLGRSAEAKETLRSYCSTQSRSEFAEQFERLCFGSAA